MASTLLRVAAMALTAGLALPASATYHPIPPHPAQSAPPMIYASSNQGAVDVLKGEVRVMVRTGLQNAANNFAVLRERPIGTSSTLFDASGSIGNYRFVTRFCVVKYFEKDGKYPAQWGYGCLSNGFTGAQGAVEVQLRDAIAAELPAEFKSVPPRDTADGDFRWENPETAVAITLRATVTKGVSTFNVQVHHELS